MPVFSHLEFLKTEMPPTRLGIVKKFVESSNLLAVLPFLPVAGPADPYMRQAALPATSKRAIGGTYTHAEGRYDPGVEFLKIMGGISTFDRFQVATGQSGRRSQEAAAFVEAIALDWERDFFKGDSSTDVLDFDGVQKRATDSGQVTQAAASGTNETALSIKKVLDCKREVSRPTHWLVGESVANLISIAAHNTAVGGYINRTKNEMGEEVQTLANLPIITIGRDASDVDILDFSETTGDTSTGQSMYCVSLRPDRLHGIQNAPVDGMDLGLDPSNGTQLNFVVEWYSAIKVEHRRSVQRLAGIGDAAVTLS